MIFTWHIEQGAIQQLTADDSTFGQSSLHKTLVAAEPAAGCDTGVKPGSLQTIAVVKTVGTSAVGVCQWCLGTSSGSKG